MSEKVNQQRKVEEDDASLEEIVVEEGKDAAKKNNSELNGEFPANNEWQFAAQVLDRFFFFALFATTVVVTVLIFAHIAFREAMTIWATLGLF